MGFNSNLKTGTKTGGRSVPTGNANQILGDTPCDTSFLEVKGEEENTEAVLEAKG